MENIVIFVVLNNLCLIPINSLGQGIDTAILTIEKNLNKLSSYTSQSLRCLVYIIRLASHIMPQFMTDLIAATCMINLSSIEDPMVIRTQAKKLALIFLTIVIKELNIIITFMFVGTIGTTSTPFDFGFHLLKRHRRIRR